MSKTHFFGVAGYPLTTTFSPDYFQEKFKKEGLHQFQYLRLPVADIADLQKEVARYQPFYGLNITLPHKQAIIPYLSEMTEVAQSIKAVNCVAIKEKQWIGHNTDAEGFQQALQPLLKPHHTRALILGNGGAAQAVQYALQQLHLPFVSVVRNKTNPDQLLYEEVDASILQTHTLIVQTTPLGMYPQVECFPPLPYHLLSPLHLLFDLVYHPAETTFLSKGKAYGATTSNGLQMLVNQAEASWRFWKSLHGF